MSSRKRQRQTSCPFASAKKPKRRKRTLSFPSSKAVELAASDRGSYFNQEVMVDKEVEREAKARGSEDLSLSASRSKIEPKITEDSLYKK